MENPSDYIILGTGLTQTILAGLLSEKGKLVSIFDSSNHYGEEMNCINIDTYFSNIEFNTTNLAF